jgi:hypothetical protein
MKASQTASQFENIILLNSSKVLTYKKEKNFKATFTMENFLEITHE